MKPFFYVMCLGLVILTGGFFLPGMANACPSNSHFTTLYSNNDLEKLKKLYPDIKDCENDTHLFYKFYIAQALFKDMESRNLTGEAKKARLDEIYQMNENHWPTLYSLGEETESAASLASWKAGYTFYERTLKMISKRSKTPDNEIPPHDFIEEVRSKLGLLQNLIAVRDPSFVPKDSARSGGYITRTRSSKAVKTQHPIRFAYKETQLTGTDLENAGALLKELNTGGAAITIIGHADRVGSQEYNLNLSIKRANTLKQFLTESGYNANIKVVGKGKTEPVEMPASFAQAMSQDEIDMLNRRVEILYHW